MQTANLGRWSAHIGGCGEGSEGKKRGYCVVYTRASRGVCRLPQRKATPSEKNDPPSEKDKTISEVISSTPEKNKTTSEENVARSLGGEVAGHFLSSGVRVLPFDAVPDFRPKVLNPC